jgi:hypothetical protein
MEFEYEISAEDYAAASILFYKLSNKRINATGWVLAGACLLAIGLIEKERGLSPILLAAIGVWWIWAGLGRLFPGNSYRRQCRKYYQRLGLDGSRYRATVNADGFEVAGGNGSWRNSWHLVSPKGEDERVFVFYSLDTLFLFLRRGICEPSWVFRRLSRCSCGLQLP